MPTLLCTLGASWAVVPEAFLLGNGEAQYSRVVILTTESELTNESLRQCKAWFAEYAPGIEVSPFQIQGLSDIASADDHARFEEALYRLYFHLINQTADPQSLHVCLAGGFKTISAATQEAASLLGCGKLFHITAEGKPPANHEQILAARQANTIHMVDLGPRSAWPTIHELRSDALPVSPPLIDIRDTSLIDKVRARLAAANHLAASEADLARLPFPQLARWAPGERDCLEQVVNPERDRNWVQSLPKVELHCHLGGFATHGELLRQVRAAACAPDRLPPLVEPTFPKGWPLPKDPIGLSAYFPLGDASGSKLLKDPGCLRKHCELLYQHLCEQNVVYAEIRCSPANYADPDRGRSPWDVLHDIKTTFDRCHKTVAATVQAAEHCSDDRLGCGRTDMNSGRLFQPYDSDGPRYQTWRGLPHRHRSHATVFVTFRLADSIPVDAFNDWERERSEFLATHPGLWSEPTWDEYDHRFPDRIEQWLNDAHGSCLLRNPENAGIVEAALRHFDGDHYILDDFAIMPNYVQVLVKPLEEFGLDAILHFWKSFTTKEINQREGRDGALWQKGSIDKLVRSQSQLEAVRRHIRQNPMEAGRQSAILSERGRALVTEDASGELVDTTGGTPAPTVNLIIIATRRADGDYRSHISRHLALAITAAETWTADDECRVVGVDLAGYENKETRAHYFREEFTGIHRCGLALTVHAGENDDAEGIWRAVFDLNTRRLGHALHLIDSPELMRSVAARGITVEMCPYANYQIHGYSVNESFNADCVEKQSGLAAYPLKTYLDRGIAVTVNTDNIGISDATLSDNFLLASHLCPGLTRLNLLTFIRNAIDGAFLTPSQKQTILASIHIPPP